MKDPSVHIIICSWKRIPGIKSLLLQLCDQTYKNFKVTITNNNVDEISTLDSFVVEITTPYNLCIEHNEINIGGRGRFVTARNTDCEYCVFLDDDQTIEPHLIQNMVSTASQRTIGSWWGWKFSKSYWNRVRVLDGSEANYCGTGGMIVHSSIFKNPSFWERWEPRYYFVEDLYLSLYAGSIGWALKGNKYPMDFNKKLYLDNGSLCLNTTVHNSKELLTQQFLLKGFEMPANNTDNFSYKYWENRYATGGNSGYGSYENFLTDKVKLLTQLVSDLGICSIADVGCGDCTILPHLTVERYVGYDISPTVINRHIQNNSDVSHTFRLIHDPITEPFDMALSLDVIFHQVDDVDYNEYIRHLVNTNAKYILILTMNDRILSTEHAKAAHVKYRDVQKSALIHAHYVCIYTYPHTLDTSTYYLYKRKEN